MIIVGLPGVSSGQVPTAKHDGTFAPGRDFGSGVLGGRLRVAAVIAERPHTRGGQVQQRPHGESRSVPGRLGGRTDCPFGRCWTGHGNNLQPPRTAGRRAVINRASRSWPPGYGPTWV